MYGILKIVICAFFVKISEGIKGKRKLRQKERPARAAKPLCQVS
jgi:hypothetical protein